MINGALFFLTLLTTTVGGSLFQGGNPFGTPADLARGLPYSMPLMSILLAHELGHYFACRRHRLKATLPYFIPVPPPIFLFGTLGAFIKIKSPIQDRRALLDVGVAGPLAGMVLALPVAAVGISLSEFVTITGQEGNLLLGESLLFRFLMELIKGPAPEGAQLLLHPVAFAGWIGFLVTAFNLLPASQLDGGHIFYSLWPRKHRLMTRLVVLSLLVLGLVAWQGWVLWALLVTLMGTRHPPVVQDLEPRGVWPFDQPSSFPPGLDQRRRRLGVMALVIFGVTFTPVPLKITFPEIPEPTIEQLEPPQPKRQRPPPPLGDDWVWRIPESEDLNTPSSLPI
jgi:membrane-associated protease RseP (regulator of RpoE activity)